MSRFLLLFCVFVSLLLACQSEQSCAQGKKMDQQNVLKQIEAFGGITDYGLKGEEEGILAISLKNTTVTDGEINNLMLDVFPHLAKLDLSSTKVTDNVAKKIGAIKSLRFLYLAHTNISDVALKDLRKISNLQKLDLSHTKVTDSGVGTLKSFSYLTYVDLSNTGVTKAGLASVVEIKSIERIRLQNTNISSGELAIFAEKYPSITFEN